jgi:hypothetical protein
VGYTHEGYTLLLLTLILSPGMMRGIYKKVYDPSKGVSYYYNTRTGAAQWTKPKILGDDDCPSFDKERDHIATDEEKKKFSKKLRTHPMNELEGALMIQNAWRTRDARKRLHLLMQGVYEKVTDELSGKVFYYNTITGESLWEKPKAFGDDDALTPRSREELAYRLEEENDVGKVRRKAKQAEEQAAYKKKLREEQGPLTEEEAALHIQGLWRSRAARKMMVQMMGQVFEKAYDENIGACYYYNKRTGEATWERPKLLGNEDIQETPRSAAAEAKRKEEIETEKKDFEEAQLAKRAKEESEANSRKMERLRLLRERGGMTQEEAAVHIQGLWRTREARKMMSLMMHQVFEKVWDPATGQCYYHNKRTGESSWVKPTVFGDHDDLEIL